MPDPCATRESRGVDGRYDGRSRARQAARDHRGNVRMVKRRAPPRDAPCECRRPRRNGTKYASPRLEIDDMHLSRQVGKEITCRLHQNHIDSVSALHQTVRQKHRDAPAPAVSRFGIKRAILASIA